MTLETTDLIIFLIVLVQLVTVVLMKKRQLIISYVALATLIWELYILAKYVKSLDQMLQFYLQIISSLFYCMEVMFIMS